MKELTVKEKAKRYDEVINRMKHYVIDEYGCSRIKVADVFPELKESEDEKMRAMAIKAVHAPEAQSCIKSWGINPEDVIAWIEKQGEQKPILDVEIPFGIDSELVEEAIAIPDGCYAIIEDNKVILRKRENKPKFRVGDTIKCKHDDRQFTIKSVNLDKGIYTYTQEGCGNDIDYADEEFELVEQKPAEWSEEGKQNLKIEGYENLSDYEKIFDDIADKYVRNKNQKGYNQSWYVKERAAEMLYQANKELKKKVSWSEEDERHENTIIRAIHGAGNITPIEGELAEKWLKSLRPQNSWKPSEEQMDALESAVSSLQSTALESLYQKLNELM